MERPELARKRGELSLSGASFAELMAAVLERGKPFRFRAKGWSMSPFVKEGDVVTVSPLLGRTPRPGDIAAFLLPASGRAAVHRVVRRTPGGLFFLRGDNAAEAEGPVAASRILGIVTAVSREGRPVRLVHGRLGPAIAFLSRTGGLVRGLGWLRAAARRVRREGR